MTSKINLGIERVSHLLRRLNNPHLNFDVIHVAGTNGKGSVAAMLANTLKNAGIQTGLFTSPHLKYRWDGIRINQNVIEPAEYKRINTMVQGESQKTVSDMLAQGHSNSDVSSFEQMTATAFAAFREQQVQVAVIEVGLGGLHDATNVVRPILSVITSIGIDHEAFLGSSIQEITRQKGGIIKPGVPVVVSSDQEHSQVFGVLGQIQKDVSPGCKLIWTPPNSTTDFRTSNRNTARTALETMRNLAVKGNISEAYNLSDDMIETGLETTLWPGRCSTEDLRLLGGPPRTLIDGAHNPQSIGALATILAATPVRRVFIVSATKGKDFLALRHLFKPGDSFFAVEFEKVDDMQWIEPVGSSELCSDLLEVSMSGVNGQAYGKDVLGAIRDSRTIDSETELVICGSLYLVGQVYRLLENAHYEDEAFPEIGGGSLGPYDPTMIENKVHRYWNNLPPTNPVIASTKLRTLEFLLPPPNVTGSLHIGHALTVAIQDAYCRHYRSKGHEVRWVPGIDHAGIATQSVVSKSLAKAGIEAKDLKRHDFVTKIWDWRRQYGAIITEQIKRMGTSLDWNLEYFTMDEPRVLAVQEAFRRLWEDGLISRQNRMVNWSIPLQSVISDIEVDSRVIETPTTLDGVEYGKMWRIRYELLTPTTEQSYLEVDTTRPETVFGDRALAVHPADERYTSLIGRKVKHPLLTDVAMVIVADSLVKKDFGTGCVKLTPAHDVKDYEIAQRHHNIPCIEVYGCDGRMLAIPDYPELEGQDRLASRSRVVAILETKNALVSTQPHRTTLNLCSRSGALIEPLIIPQWYIAMQSLADSVQQRNDIKMTSKTLKEWNKWLSNVQDWCVSRQLVWGHRIPLWRVTDPSSTAERWVFGSTYAEASSNAAGLEVVQDTDVLDTWFSSGLLPLSAFGWPSTDRDSSKEIDLQDLPKTNNADRTLEFIESGPDILFFWIVRMAMLCTFVTNSSPFREIVLHPLIRDSEGRKMSKSLGNVIDPVSLIEGRSLDMLLDTLDAGNLNLAESKTAAKEIRLTYPNGMLAYGADTLRLALIHSTVQDEALKFDVRSMTSARYLSTKLWNAVNFYLFNLDKYNLAGRDLQQMPWEDGTLVDHWILFQLRKSSQMYDIGFQNRELWSSTQALRTFTVEQLCDVYLEFVKIDLRELSQDRNAIAQKLWLLREILTKIICLYASFMPHVTEYLWHALGVRGSIHRRSVHDETQIVSQIPGAMEHNTIQRMSIILKLLQTLRTLPTKEAVNIKNLLADKDPTSLDIATYLPHLQVGANLQSLLITTEDLTFDKHVPITNEIEITYNSGRKNAAKTLVPSSAEQRALKKLEKLRSLVSTADYNSRVPAEVKMKHLSEINDLEIRLKNFVQQV
ncbi:protein of unknown function [Taphrina deformans PYCC 5710]|uniref:valine--tRNA ligase n=1 Tax=Taphrina deformans (strain PYCC 5710 / ATCC 11124 / CBS 356.35 / IMI 108563 / JCM 9778 / NBRC 8474) TaxID=1097556 RepID=R4XDU8_TAPDE|nr:protein of unknown function [Taphrina deformans PYCC 5710]|eukprot:CCG83812.1 protein of unknown function [Taphrina deformans PYCC 5710]